MPEYRAALMDRAASTEKVMRFVASTEDPGRDGMIVKADGWQLENYRKNPVVLFGHRYGEPPIGRADVKIDGKRLLADVTWDLADPFAASIARKYADGFLSAVSVGWDTLQTEPSSNPNIRAVVTKSELLDISAVPVPGDPDALLMRQKRGLQTMATDILKLIEPDPTETPPEPSATWEAAATAMARFVLDPAARQSGDRRDAYRYLVADYARFGKTAPEFRTNDELDGLGPDEIRGLFLCGEPDLIPAVFNEFDQRAGATLSARNEDDLNRAIRLIRGVIDRAGKEEGAESDDGDERAARLLHSVLMAGAAR